MNPLPDLVTLGLPWFKSRFRFSRDSLRSSLLARGVTTNGRNERAGI